MVPRSVQQLSLFLYTADKWRVTLKAEIPDYIYAKIPDYINAEEIPDHVNAETPDYVNAETPDYVNAETSDYINASFANVGVLAIACSSCQPNMQEKG